MLYRTSSLFLLYTHLTAQLLGVPGQQFGHASQGILAHALAVVTRLTEQLLDLTATVSRLPLPEWHGTCTWLLSSNVAPINIMHLQMVCCCAAEPGSLYQHTLNA